MQQTKRSTHAPPRSSRVVTTPKIPVVDSKSVSDEQTKEEQIMREELLKKQKELRALQKKKLKMMQEQKHLETNRILVKPELVNSIFYLIFYIKHFIMCVQIVFVI